MAQAAIPFATRPMVATRSMVSTVDHLGGGEAFIGFVDDVGGEENERRAVNQGCEYLHAVEAIGTGGRGGPGRQLKGNQAEEEGHDIGQHVAGVTHQGERIREVPAYEFNKHDDPGDPNGNQQGFPVPLKTVNVSSGADAFMSMMFMLIHFYTLRRLPPFKILAPKLSSFFCKVTKFRGSRTRDFGVRSQHLTMGGASDKKR